MKNLLLWAWLLLAQLAFAQPKTTAPAGLLGKWVNQDFGYAMLLEFNDAQSGSFEGESFSYQLKNAETMVLLIDGVPTTYRYQLQGDRLTLSGGDLDAAISFTRSGSPASSTSSAASPTPLTPSTRSTTPTPSAPSSIIGLWIGSSDTIEFRSNGKCLFKGMELDYTVTENQILLDVRDQKLPVTYRLAENELQLSLNNQTSFYRKEGSPPRTSASKNPPELAGKWCYMSNYMLNSNSGGGTGGSSNEECITLHPNGQFEYYAERSMSTNTDAYWGGTSSQNNDSGTWWFDGEKIHYQSQRTGKSGSYQLEKRNHPKNRDPMIVLDGRAYVTQFQKAPW